MGSHRMGSARTLARRQNRNELVVNVEVVNSGCSNSSLLAGRSRVLRGLLPALLLPVLSGSLVLAQAPAAGPAAGPAVSAPGVAPTPAQASQQARPGGTDATKNSADRQTTEDRNRRDPTPGILQEVPSEFQRLVQESTGTPLPIFGASLFNGVPSTFAPDNDIPVAPDYVIGPGDELRVQVYGQVNVQGNFVVDRTGNIAFPEIGSLHVAGIRYDRLAGFLKSQLDRVYRNFEVNVNLGQLRSMQVFVTGNARRPGAYTLSSLSTLLNAIFASGGPLPQGSMRDIQLKRTAANATETVVHFDLYDLLLKGDKSKDIQLAPGDVLFIPPVGDQVAVSGSVNNPAIYEITPGTTVDQLILLAGGETSVALGKQVRLERIFEHTLRSIVDVPQGKDIALANGDILSVGAILNRYSDAVTLRGNVTTPGRYVWHPGMRITDLVPSADQLITRNYYARRNALGNTSADYGGVNPNGTSASGLNTGALAVRGDSTDNVARGALATGRANASGSSTGGGSVGDALTTSNNTFTATTDLILSAADLDWNYAVIERLDRETLTTSLISFKPGDLYQRNDQSQNLPLLVGDVVTFFSTADLKVPTSQQTRYVRLEGEFVASGVYSVLPGETLRHLLIRAGGFTQDAYLYGSEFTRKSTQRVQQQRLNEYADSLEAQISILAANNNARAVSDRDAAAANASTVDSQEAVARLRRATPLGRIVLELKPDSRGTDAVADIPLEDGDRFVVPRVPSTVNVEGQVYSANSFLYEHGRREQDYLRQAGGPDRQADRRRTFILRADGSVYSRQYGNVDRATMFPGDTIVVPPQLSHRALLRDLVDIAGIISGFGLGAAAINVLK
jgi:polysaccharide export outer membrane protein